MRSPYFVNVGNATQGNFMSIRNLSAVYHWKLACIVVGLMQFYGQVQNTHDQRVAWVGITLLLGACVAIAKLAGRTPPRQPDRYTLALIGGLSTWVIGTQSLFAVPMIATGLALANAWPAGALLLPVLFAAYVHLGLSLLELTLLTAAAGMTFLTLPTVKSALSQARQSDDGMVSIYDVVDEEKEATHDRT